MSSFSWRGPRGPLSWPLLLLTVLVAACQQGENGASKPAAKEQSTTASAPESTVVKIGLLAPFSGPFAEYGPQFLGGMKTYLAQHPTAGVTYEILQKDTTGPNPELGQRLAQELIVQDKVDFLAVGGFTPETMTAGQVATRAKVPVLILNASSTDLTAKLPLSVRVSFSFRQIARPLGLWAAEQGHKQVMTLVTDYAPGHDAEQGFIAGLQEGGASVTDSVRVPLRNPDFAPFLQRVKDAKPQALLAWVPQGQQATALLKGFHERGLGEAGVKLLVLGDTLDRTALDSVGEVLVGTHSSLHYSLTHDSELNRGFVAAFTSDSGLQQQEPTFMAVAAYDAMGLIERAVSQKVRGEAAVTAMSGLDWESPRGKLHIDKTTRDLSQNVYIRDVVQQDGRLQNVEVKTFEALRP